MSQIFKSEFIEKEFIEFYQTIIPNLNNCNSSNVDTVLFINIIAACVE